MPSVEFDSPVLDFLAGEPRPKNPHLWAKIKSEAKRKFDVYPSIPANSWLVARYKKRGGKFKGERKRGGLTKWYDEKWVDISRPLPGGGFAPCTRPRGGSRRGYPKCLPIAKARKLSTAQIRSAVRRKRKAVRSAPARRKKPVYTKTVLGDLGILPSISIGFLVVAIGLVVYNFLKPKQ